ncbi:carboxymuconolactone decarboxylase family protein [Rhizobium sp. PL01]|uniref:carboxymuconolactone decarboxylase family protein n=1 Tax=Rhizobium sp. PL01 TaxID=3085631 RepID=UPI00298144AE|nr:carboxymuconolactone decarboxylase family protein [Rhizobium sp. PL01]MDW5312997.1 carboxymuconolactone decarboxylase family protein [Rhizobium sp. PL01]
MVAKNQTAELAYHLTLALENGVKPSQISEIITHLAFYSGWASATSAVAIAKGVFGARGVTADQLPEATPTPLPFDEAADAQRANGVEQNVGPGYAGVVEFTNGLLFNELWLRPGLAPRDRSLVTVTTLIANGQSAQIPFHPNCAMDNGLTQAEESEVLTQVAFYAGWPMCFQQFLSRRMFSTSGRADGGRHYAAYSKRWPRRLFDKKSLQSLQVRQGMNI